MGAGAFHRPDPACALRESRAHAGGRGEQPGRDNRDLAWALSDPREYVSRARVLGAHLPFARWRDPEPYLPTIWIPDHSRLYRARRSPRRAATREEDPGGRGPRLHAGRPARPDAQGAAGEDLPRPAFRMPDHSAGCQRTPAQAALFLGLLYDPSALRPSRLRGR